MTPLAQPTITPAEYLRLERAADHRSELINGRIYAMSGASRRHNLIVVNLSREISSQLRGRPCETYANEMRVKVRQTGMYTYPDIVALCDEPRFEDDVLDTLLNPSVIIEVLSDSTERYDRGDKFEHYRRLESLREYVLIAQDRPRVEKFVREGDGWKFTEVNDFAETFAIDALGCVLSLADVYDRVTFPPLEDRKPR